MATNNRKLYITSKKATSTSPKIVISKRKYIVPRPSRFKSTGQKGYLV